jgi:pilus assembly protein CpaE
MTAPETSHLVIVAADAKLREELLASLASLGQRAPISHPVETARQGIESVRNRLPQVVLIELTHDVKGVAAFVHEVSACSPGSIVAAILPSQVPGEDVSEGDVLIELIRAGVKDFLRRPVATGDLRSLLARAENHQPTTVARQGCVVSFVSNKGGVGKSTTAINVACGLAVRHPGRVLLVDASLQLGVCASMLDLQPTVTLTDAARQRERLDETLVAELAVPHACGLTLLAAPRDAVEAAEVDDDALARVLTIARRRFDYVIVDTFPMFDRIVVAVLDMSDRAYIVLESVVPTLLGGHKLLRLLSELGYAEARQRIVLNRYARVTGGVTPQDVAQRLGRNVDHVLPYDKRIITAANCGEPVALRRTGWFGYGKQLEQIVADVEGLHPDAHAQSNGHVK